jgi:hypothetical protein
MDLSKFLCAMLFMAALGLSIGMLSRSAANGGLDFEGRTTITVVMVLCLAVLGGLEIAMIWKLIIDFMLREDTVITGFASLKRTSPNSKTRATSVSVLGNGSGN